MKIFKGLRSLGKGIGNRVGLRTPSRHLAQNITPLSPEDLQRPSTSSYEAQQLMVAQLDDDNPSIADMYGDGSEYGDFPYENFYDSGEYAYSQSATQYGTLSADDELSGYQALSEDLFLDHDNLPETSISDLEIANNAPILDSDMPGQAKVESEPEKMDIHEQQYSNIPVGPSEPIYSGAEFIDESQLNTIQSQYVELPLDPSDENANPQPSQSTSSKSAKPLPLTPPEKEKQSRMMNDPMKKNVSNANGSKSRDNGPDIEQVSSAKFGK